MKTKTINILYWTLTSLFALFLVADGLAGAFQVEDAVTIFQHLGYPLYLLVFLGIAKVLASIAIVQRRFSTLKEWAFAGLTTLYVGAFFSRASAGDSVALIISPLIFLAVMFSVYYLDKRVNATRPYVRSMVENSSNRVD
jgi:hypothetical protein